MSEVQKTDQVKTDVFNTTLSDRVAEIVKDRIINNEIQPGERISIKAFSDEFRTSSTPIRDALNKLAARGMVEVSPRVGYYVKTFTDKEVDDIFFVRTKLELAILEAVFETITPEEMGNWRAIDRKYANRDLTREEMRAFSRKDSFHLLLCGKCENTYLREVYMTFFEKVLLISSVIAHDYSHYADHSDILDAIETGNLSTAKEALVTHLELARRSVHEHLA